MPKKIRLYAYAAFVTFAMIGLSHAQTFERPNDVPMPPVIDSPEQIDKVSPDLQPGPTRATQALLTEIVSWLSTNFDLPWTHDHPRVELVPAMKLASMRYKGVLPDRWREDSIYDPAVQAVHHREVLALYNDTTKTIFLSEAWAGTTPAELSILVHEMVHHLQNLAKLKYECPAAREKLAYQAQDQWLKRIGQDLEKEFEIDMLTLLVTSGCIK